MTDINDLIAQITAFLADAPKDMPHEGYRYGELLSQAATTLREQHAEIARLRAERDEWEHKAGQYMDERDAAMKDAERYRWLRDQMMHARSGSCFGWTLSELYPGDDQDAAIDAAIAAAAESRARPQP